MFVKSKGFRYKVFVRTLCKFDNGMDVSDCGFSNGFFNRLGFNGSVTFPMCVGLSLLVAKVIALGLLIVGVE